MVKKVGTSSRRTGISRGRRSRLSLARRVRSRLAAARSRAGRSAPAGQSLPGSSTNYPCIPEPDNRVTSPPSPIMAGVDYIIPPPSGFEDVIPTPADGTWIDIPTEGLCIHENYAHNTPLLQLLHEWDVAEAMDGSNFSEPVTSVSSPPSGRGYIITPPPGFEDVIPIPVELLNQCP